MKCQFFWDFKLLYELSVLLGCYIAVLVVSSSGTLHCCVSCHFFWDVTLMYEMSVLLECYNAV